MSESSLGRIAKSAGHRLLVATGGAALTLVFFLVLPLTQTIARPPAADLTLHTVDSTALPPPPPPPPEEEPPEEDEQEEPPELADEAPPLDLSQLELALNPGFSGDWLAADFRVDLNVATSGGDLDALFSLSDLDQKPRALYQPSPTLDNKMRRKTPATVYIIFVVNERGQTEEAAVQSSTDPIFERAALSAVKQWRFEPGKRNGQAVRFRMRVPITFPKGS